jgi:hypothetical protein
MRYQAKAGYQEEGREGDAVEDADNHHKREQSRCDN